MPHFISERPHVRNEGGRVTKPVLARVTVVLDADACANCAASVHGSIAARVCT